MNSGRVIRGLCSKGYRVYESTSRQKPEITHMTIIIQSVIPMSVLWHVIAQSIQGQDMGWVTQFNFGQRLDLSFVHHIQPVSFLGLKLTFSNMLTRVGSPLPCSTWRWRQIKPQSFISFFALWQFQNFSHSYDTSIKFYENLVKGNQAVTWRKTDGQ